MCFKRWKVRRFERWNVLKLDREVDMPHQTVTHAADGDDEAWASLSRRDIQFIGELVAGRTDLEIAHKLGQNVRQVRAQIRSICDKVGVRGRTELVREWKQYQDSDDQSEGD